MFQSLARAGCLVGALTGAAALSQYPAFTDAYLQRLGGTVDALAEVVRDFDVSALEAGFTRGEALAEMSGTPFLEARATDMRRTFARHVVLTDQLSRLRNATAIERIWMAPELRDMDTLKAAWADFAPALPMSTAGALTGGVGFLAGWGLIAAVFAMLARLFRRVPKRGKTAPVRKDPPVARPTTDPYRTTPRLMGETRP